MRWSSLKSEMFSMFYLTKNAAVIYITHTGIYITAAHTVYAGKILLIMPKKRRNTGRKYRRRPMLTIMERKKGESARDYVTRVLIDNIVNVHLEPGKAAGK